jgi:hypothetical protein
VAKSLGELGREKNIFDRIDLDCSDGPLLGRGAAWLAGSDRPPDQGENASDRLRTVLKSNGDKASVTRAQLTYGMAEGEMDSVIAGLTTALVEGGDPSGLPTAQASLETAGRGLKEICDAANKMVTPNTKGVLEEIAKGAVEPLFNAISDGVGALWTRHVENDKLEIETKKTQLEAAKWPKFSDIAAQ